jgi:hypothetical protein
MTYTARRYGDSNVPASVTKALMEDFGQVLRRLNVDLRPRPPKYDDAELVKIVSGAKPYRGTSALTCGPSQAHDLMIGIDPGAPGGDFAVRTWWQDGHLMHETIERSRLYDGKAGEVHGFSFVKSSLLPRGARRKSPHIVLKGRSAGLSTGHALWQRLADDGFDPESKVPPGRRTEVYYALKRALGA